MNLMKQLFLAVVVLLLSNQVNAQSIVWQDTTAHYELPEGIELYYGKTASPIGPRAWLLKLDVTQQQFAFVPYLSKANGGVQTLSSFASQVGAVAAINGGFFSTSNGASFSTVVQPGEVLSRNITALTRNGKSYPVIRSMFNQAEDKTMSVEWVYHFNDNMNGLYRFTQPLDYATDDADPRPVPSINDGELFENAHLGIGGGPVLIKGDSIRVSWSEEIFWGSGVNLNDLQLRSAIGYTADGKILLFVSDTKGTGITLPNLALELKALGCVEAMNLDGGGSSQLVVKGNKLNSNTDVRLIPSIVAIVPQDSVPGYVPPAEFEQIIDTGDADKVIKMGGGWFETANPGFYGATKSLLHPVGDGSATFSFKPSLPVEGEYEVYSWWVASFNRSKQTPHVVYHKNGVDTVKMNQSTSDAQWVKVGTFTFTGSPSDSVVISNKTPETEVLYVVADAVKFVKVKSTSISDENLSETANGIELNGNYPNPFNPSTQIRFSLGQSGKVVVTIYSVLGQEIQSFSLGNRSAGSQAFTWDASGFNSGMYLYRIQQQTSTGMLQSVGKMTLIK